MSHLLMERRGYGVSMWRLEEQFYPELVQLDWCGKGYGIHGVSVARGWVG